MISYFPLTIEVVSSLDDLEAVYRLRYGQVGRVESNLELPESKKYRDIHDTPYSTILAAKADNQIIGTLRMVPRSAGPFIMDDAYDWQLLSLQLGLDTNVFLNQTMLFDRLVVQQNFRRRGLSGALFNQGACIAQAQDKKYIVIVAPLGNISIKSILKNSFQEYAQHKFNGHQMVHFFAQTEDILNSN